MTRAFLAVAGREWLAGWRRGSGYAARGLFAGILLAAGAFLAVQLAIRFDLEPEDYAQLSRALFAAFARIEFLLAVLFSTFVFSSGFVREREQGTLELLLLVPAPRAALAAALLTGGLMNLLALLAAGIPVFSFLVLIGGVSAGEILAVHAILTGEIAAVGAAALLAALLERKAYRIVLYAWFLSFGWLAAPYALEFYFPEAGPARAALFALNPYAILDGMLASGGADAAAAGQVLAQGALLFSAACLLAGLLLEWSHERSRETSEGRWWRRWLARIRGAAARSRRLARLFRPVLPVRHPLAVRECSFGNDPSFRAAWLAFALFYTAVAGASLFAPEWVAEDLNVLLPVCGFAVGALLAVVHAGFTIASDRRSGIFEVLLAANLPPEAIVRAKFAGEATRLFYLTVLPVIHGILTLLFLDGFSARGFLLFAAFLPQLLAGQAAAVLLTLAFFLNLRSTLAGLALALFFSAGAMAFVAGQGGAFVSLAASRSGWTPAAMALLPGLLFLPLFPGLYALTVHRFRTCALRR